MKLDVITGYREYLGPAPLPEAELVRFLADASHEVSLANVGWSPLTDRPFDASFTLDRGNVREATADLLLEYLLDTHRDNDRVAVVLPVEALVHASPGKRGTAGAGFIARAVQQLGERQVRVARLSLSQNSQEVLRTLGSRVGEKARGKLSLGDVETIELQAKSTPGLPSPYLAMGRNYTEAVLKLCERLMSDKLTFSGAGRVEFVVNEMAKNNLSIRPDLSVDRILETIEPGGEIFELLSRPFATTGNVTP